MSVGVCGVVGVMVASSRSQGHGHAQRGATRPRGSAGPGALWVVLAAQKRQGRVVAAVGGRRVLGVPFVLPAATTEARQLASQKGGVSKPPKGAVPGPAAVAGRGAAGGCGGAAVVVWGGGCVALYVDEKRDGARHNQQNDEWLVWSIKAKWAGSGLLAIQKRNAGHNPTPQPQAPRGWGRCGRVCVAPGVSVQRHATKKGEPEPPTRANGADPLCQQGSTWSDHPHDVAEAGCTIGAPCGGRTGQEACPVHVCV
jgi:hypothetical protein